MAKLPFRDTTKFLLDQRIVSCEYGRPYLGMSSIGEECTRKLWYGFHFVTKSKLRARTKRIFDVGHTFEAIIIAELKAIGVDVYKIVDGKQIELTGHIEEDQEELLGFCGHESGHSDGRAKGFVEFPDEELLLELKTMKQETFAKVKKLGFEEVNPVYFAQTQRYMREKKLKRVCFIAINKNTCEYHIEFSDYNKSIADDLARKGRDIILSDTPPKRAYIEGYWKCFNCGHNKVCHYDFEPEMNCRTCAFSDIANNGVWECTNRPSIDTRTNGACEDEYELSLEEQKVGCSFYKKGWGL